MEGFSVGQGFRGDGNGLLEGWELVGVPFHLPRGCLEVPGNGTPPFRCVCHW